MKFHLRIKRGLKTVSAGPFEEIRHKSGKMIFPKCSKTRLVLKMAFPLEQTTDVCPKMAIISGNSSRKCAKMAANS
jgi:hypothetical protein